MFEKVSRLESGDGIDASPKISSKLLVTPGREVLETPPARGLSSVDLATPVEAEGKKPNRRQRRAAPLPCPVPEASKATPAQPMNPQQKELEALKAQVTAQAAALQKLQETPKVADPRAEEIKQLQQQAAAQAALIEQLRNAKASEPSPAKVGKPSPSKSSKPSPSKPSKPPPSHESQQSPLPSPSETGAASDEPADVIITPDGAKAVTLVN